MKTGKKLIALAAVGAAVVSLGALAACEPKTPDDGKTPGGDTTPQIAYQFTGEFTNDTLKGYGFDYHIMLNLYDNNKIVGSSYNNLTMDTRPAAENSGFAAKWLRGNWEVSKDEEDQDCLKLKIIYDEDAKNGMNGAQLTNTSEYYVLKKTDGSLENFRMQSPIFSGTSEYMTDMTQNKTPYKTADEFIAAKTFTETLPTEYEALFQSTSDSSVAARIYLLADGKAENYSGKKNPAKDEYKYVKAGDWTWSYTGGALKVSDGGNTYDATVTGNTAVLEYTVNLQGHEMNYKYSCADISGLSEGGEVAQPVVVFTGANNSKIDVFEDGTAKLSAFGMLNIDMTWTYSASNSLVFTDAEKPEKTYTATITGSAATVTYSDTLAGNPISIELSCDDISKIIATAPIATFNGGTAGNKLEIYANNKAKASFFNGAMNIDFTWTLASGTLTLTDAVNTSKVYASSTEESITTIKIQDGYANDTFTVDLSLLA